MARLDEICTINMGQSPDSSSYNNNGDGLPFFQGNADFGEIHPRVRVWCNSPTKIANPGDILISVRAPIGALNIADTQCCIGRGLAALTVDESVCDRKYLWYTISGKVDELNAKGTGSTFKAISKGILAETEIPIVPLEEQKRIGMVLDRVFHLIALRKKQLQKLDDLVKARFVEIFGDPEFNTKGWPVQPLDKLCDVGSSKRIYQNEQSQQGIPFWRVSDLVSKMDTGIADSGLFIAEEIYLDLKKGGLVPVAGDILVTSRGTLGRCYIIKEEDRFYFQDGMISWLSRFDKSITPLYLQYLFSMPGLRKQIDRTQAGSTVAYLSIAMLKKLRVMVPSKGIQDHFSSFVFQTDKSKKTIQQSIEKLEILKQSLMQQYFG